MKTALWKELHIKRPLRSKWQPVFTDEKRCNETMNKLLALLFLRYRPRDESGEGCYRQKYEQTRGHAEMHEQDSGHDGHGRVFKVGRVTGRSKYKLR